MKFHGHHVISGKPWLVDVDRSRANFGETSGPATEDIFISPGWIDLQVNGFAGYDFNGPHPSPSHVRKVADHLAEEGVSQFFPTVITQSAEQTQQCLRAIAQGCEMDAAANDAVGGIHLEGPWISPIEGARGAHPIEHVRPPDWAEFQLYQEAAGGRIRVVTLAPEIEGAMPFIRQLTAQGIIVSLGHTMADGATISAAADAGATLSTHLGNGAPSLLPRHPNLIWDQLAEDRLTASVIFDGHHLSGTIMKVIARAKPENKLILVSDAAAPARCAPGIHETSIGGRVELNAAGRLSMLGTPYLAGAALGMVDGISNAVHIAGCRLSQACAMASENVAHLLGETISDSTVTIFRKRKTSPAIEVLATIRSGNVIFVKN